MNEIEREIEENEKVRGVLIRISHKYALMRSCTFFYREIVVVFQSISVLYRSLNKIENLSSVHEVRRIFKSTCAH